MNGTAVIPNPSDITVMMGNVTFDLGVDGTPIGVAYLNDLVLTPGNNLVPMTSTINQTTVLSLISDLYPSGVLPVTITGNSSTYNGQRLPYFEAALRSDTLNVTLDVASALQDIGVNITALNDLTRRQSFAELRADSGISVK